MSELIDKISDNLLGAIAVLSFIGITAIIGFFTKKNEEDHESVDKERAELVDILRARIDEQDKKIQQQSKTIQSQASEMHNLHLMTSQMKGEIEALKALVSDKDEASVGYREQVIKATSEIAKIKLLLEQHDKQAVEFREAHSQALIDNNNTLVENNKTMKGLMEEIKKIAQNAVK